MKLKKLKTKHWILILITAIIILTILEKPEPQIIAPSCFSKEDCKQPVRRDYCDVDYDCIIGKCYSFDVKCPEDCGIKGDEDLDGKADCDDDDCWETPYCPCRLLSFNYCAVGRCYCPRGMVPKWHVSEEEGNWCGCEVK